MVVLGACPHLPFIDNLKSASIQELENRDL